jgi:predicted DNA-binding protein (MmcQ/YjbR family)
MRYAFQVGIKNHMIAYGLTQKIIVRINEDGVEMNSLMRLCRGNIIYQQQEINQGIPHIFGRLWILPKSKSFIAMDLETLRKYCLEKNRTTESFPFGESTLVFKVSGKMFLLIGLDNLPLQFNVKCDPEKAEMLREEYSSVIPAFHMNKKHWNTIILNGQLTTKQIREMIDESYALVVRSLPLKERKKLGKN